MRLIRHGMPGDEKPGVEIEGKRYDTSGLGEDYNEQFWNSKGIERLSAYVKQHRNNLLPVDPGVRWASPVARPSKIVCIGLNYSDHARETGAALPEEPVVFLKATSALCGPFDNIILPKGSVKTDWEVELAVVIGRTCRYVSEANAATHIAGYAVLNDLSEREYQLERGGAWDKGKGCDSFAPLGPCLVTPDEAGDPHNLGLWLKVNGVIRQQSTTANLIFGIPFLIAYLSRFMTLLPGDVISTGTPSGVGLGMDPQCYLAAGDICELGIDGLGISRQQVIAYEED